MYETTSSNIEDDGDSWTFLVFRLVFVLLLFSVESHVCAGWSRHSSMRRLTTRVRGGKEIRVEDAVQATADREARVLDSEVAEDAGPGRIIGLEEAADEWRSVTLERRHTSGVSSANTRAPDEASVEAFTPEDGVVQSEYVARGLQLTWAAVESPVLSTTCSHECIHMYTKAFKHVHVHR